jgi:hypothetical protein
MSLLNFDNSESTPSRSKKPLKLIIGVGALVGVIALGSTLAASINLNSGAPVEFGQGVSMATSCDNDITVTPQQSYSNAPRRIDIYVNDPATVGATTIIDANLESGVWEAGMSITGNGIAPGTLITNDDDAGGGLYGTIYLSKPLIGNLNTGDLLHGSSQGFFALTSVTLSHVNFWACDGKDLLLRFYNTPENSAGTSDGAGTPLFTSWSSTPGIAGSSGYNSGVGFRLDHNWRSGPDSAFGLVATNEANPYVSPCNTENTSPNAGACQGFLNDITVDTPIQTSYGTADDDTVVIHFGTQINPMRASWVNKITLESTPSVPTPAYWWNGTNNP